jgi:hypothetical protein
MFDNIIKDIITQLEGYKAVDKAVASEIDLKLSKCKNPANDSSSLL